MKIHLIYLASLFFIFLPLMATHAQVSNSYWLLDEYNRVHPEQIESSNAFSAIIEENAVRSTEPINKPIEILIVYPGDQISDYWRRSVFSFEARMQELSLPYILESHFTMAGTELALQGEIIGEGIRNPPDYLIFTLDAKRHKGMIRRVMSGGQTKVILQNITTPLKDFGVNQPFLYVGFDHGVGTKILANRYKNLYPDGAKYAVFYGTRGYVSDIRGGVFIREMEAQDNMDMVASYYTDFNREKAYNATMDLLFDGVNVDFIYSSSTDIAHGIIDALKEKNLLGKIKVNGWGGGSSELEALANKELDFTVMRMNDDNGVAMAEAIKMAQENRQDEVPLVFSGDIKLIDQETPQNILEELMNYAFRYSSN